MIPFRRPDLFEVTAARRLPDDHFQRRACVQADFRAVPVRRHPWLLPDGRPPEGDRHASPYAVPTLIQLAVWAATEFPC